jgi:hypothetical protein
MEEPISLVLGEGAWAATELIGSEIYGSGGVYKHFVYDLFSVLIAIHSMQIEISNCLIIVSRVAQGLCTFMQVAGQTAYALHCGPRYNATCLFLCKVSGPPDRRRIGS